MPGPAGLSRKPRPADLSDTEALAEALLKYTFAAFRTKDRKTSRSWMS
jgi:hypothetical protein